MYNHKVNHYNCSAIKSFFHAYNVQFFCTFIKGVTLIIEVIVSNGVVLDCIKYKQGILKNEKHLSM